MPDTAGCGVTGDSGAAMSLEQDVAAARRAVDDLEQACAQVTRHFGDTVDSRRLRVDVARMRDDLTLLCGSRPQPHAWPGGDAYWGDGFDDLSTAR
jgi:hypothetical protein